MDLLPHLASPPHSSVRMALARFLPGSTKVHAVQLRLIDLDGTNSKLAVPSATCMSDEMVHLHLTAAELVGLQTNAALSNDTVIWFGRRTVRSDPHPT